MYVPIWVPLTTSCSLHIWCDAYHFHCQQQHVTRARAYHSFRHPITTQITIGSLSNLQNLYVWWTKACIAPCSKIQLPNMLQDCHQRRYQKTSRTTWPGEPSDALLITSTLSANPCFWCFRLTNCRLECSIIKKRCNGYLPKTAWLKDRLQ